MRRIVLSSRLSPSDWAHLPSILKTAETTWLEIKTEVDYEELQTVLINTNNRELVVRLESEVKYASETWDHIKRLATLCNLVTVNTLRLCEGRCKDVDISTNKIEMSRVYLHTGNDITRLHKMVSLYESWRVGGLDLIDLRSDDWALLAQLLPTLTRVVEVVITSNSTSHPAQETLRQLWDKTEIWWTGGGWRVNNEEYGKSNDENFYKIFNKHFQ